MCAVVSQGDWIFVPRTILTIDYLYHRWTIRTTDDSYLGLFVLSRTIRTLRECLLTCLAYSVCSMF